MIPGGSDASLPPGWNEHRPPRWVPRAVLYAAPQKAQRELHWTPRYPDLDSIVGTAWRWHERQPKGYASLHKS